MTNSILVFTRDQKLVHELEQQLQGRHPIVPCETLDALPQRLGAQPTSAVLVHLEASTLNGYSPGRFIAELDEAIDSAPIYGLLDENCPPRLKKLAEKAIDDCLDFPLDYGRLGRLLADKKDVEGELSGFWSQMPHKELHGRTRSLVTFTPEMFDVMDEMKVAARLAAIDCGGVCSAQRQDRQQNCVHELPPSLAGRGTRAAMTHTLLTIDPNGWSIEFHRANRERFARLTILPGGGISRLGN